MKEKLRYLMSKKSFHVSIVIIAIVIVIFILGLVILRYHVEGETNMPFNLSKIVLISSTQAIDEQSDEFRWKFDLNQANDIFLYIEKNNDYSKQELIKSITIDNIVIEKENEKSNIKLYKPSSKEENKMFSNNEEDQIEKVEYIGDVESNIKQLKISNQGGIVVFRCSNESIGKYSSNEEEINHDELLKKANISIDDIKASLKFDINILLESGKQYKATNVKLEIPVDGIIENGTSNQEITDLKEVVFKRQ